jgi:hypothetical protein
VHGVSSAADSLSSTSFLPFSDAADSLSSTSFWPFSDCLLPLDVVHADPAPMLQENHCSVGLITRPTALSLKDLPLDLKIQKKNPQIVKLEKESWLELHEQTNEPDELHLKNVHTTKFILHYIYMCTYASK